MRNIFFVIPLLIFNISASDNNRGIIYQDNEIFAQQCDENDSLAYLRDQFLIPTNESGVPLIYLCGHSLGLQPKTTKKLMNDQLDVWAASGVEGHFQDNTYPWYPFHTFVRNQLAGIVGALSHEVVAMNSLTVNLHLMMVSFYNPTPTRYKVLMEAPVFSSDTYAIKSQIAIHGYDSNEALVIANNRPGEDCLRMEDIDALLDERGNEIALVLLSGVNYFTGQFIDMQRVANKAHEKGCIVGFDLAHAIGNVPLLLHDWKIDFAVWCSYKYLNSGPGAIGGVFVHEKHGRNHTLQRFAGWWGNDPATRFALHLQPEFVPVPSADAWQISNPSIFSCVPLLASVQIFDSVGMKALREKSLRLTGYLEYLLDAIKSDRISIITPRDWQARGCQISIRVNDRPEELMALLREAGIVCDFRKPNVLRITPVPLYNTFHDVWQFAQVLKMHLSSRVVLLD